MREKTKEYIDGVIKKEILKGRRNYQRKKSTEKYRTKNREAQRLYRLRNPLKIKARKKIFIEIRAGRLKKGKCENCGSDGAHAHHENHKKPLDVKWLCRRCHYSFHSHFPEIAISI